MKELLTAILEWGGGQIQNWLKNGGEDGYYLWVAPHITVLLFALLSQKLVQEAAEQFTEKIWVSILTVGIVLIAMVLANLVSSIVMRVCLKSIIFAKIYKKISAYEKFRINTI